MTTDGTPNCTCLRLPFSPHHHHSHPYTHRNLFALEVLGTLLERHGATVVQSALVRCWVPATTTQAAPSPEEAAAPAVPRVHAGNATDIVTRARALLVAGDLDARTCAQLHAAKCTLLGWA